MVTPQMGERDEHAGYDKDDGEFWLVMVVMMVQYGQLEWL